MKDRGKQIRFCALIVSSVLYVTSACNQTRTIAVNEFQTVEANNAVNSKTSNSFQTTIRVFGWWWSEDQLASGLNLDNPPPKDSYVELESWNAGGGLDFPHPDKIDIVCSVQNNSKIPIDVTLVGRVDFRILSYKELSSQYSEEEVRQKLESSPWKDERNVGKINVGTIGSRESRDVAFRDFDLQKILNKYFESKNDLWAWQMRIEVDAVNTAGEVFNRSTKILNLIPGD